MEESNRSRVAKRNIVLYISIAVLIVSLTFSFSYAYFTASVQGTGKNNVIETGNIKIEFEDSEVITATDMVIISDEEVETKSEKSTFKLHNTGSLDVKYMLVLNPTISSNLRSADFKWQLLSDGVVVNSGNFANVVNAADMDLTNIATLESGASKNYEFRIWLSETNQNQIALTNGTFRGIIKAVAMTNVNEVNEVVIPGM